MFLKLYEKIYAPLTAGILQPFAADQSIPKEKITALDRRYTAVIQSRRRRWLESRLRTTPTMRTKSLSGPDNGTNGWLKQRRGL